MCQNQGDIFFIGKYTFIPPI